MAKPTTLIDWAIDTNYPAGVEPEAGTPTKVAPTTGQGTIGHRPDQIPTAQEDNYQRAVVGQWIRWSESRKDEDIILGPFAGTVIAGWGGHVDGYMKSSGAGSWLRSLPMVHGERLRRYSFGLKGNGAANLDVTLRKNVGGVVSMLITTPYVAPAAAYATHTIDVLTVLGSAASLALSDPTAHVYLEFAASAANIEVYDVRYAKDDGSYLT